MSEIDVEVLHTDSVFVAGEWIPGTKQTDVISPTTEQSIVRVAVPDLDHARASVDAARDAGVENWSLMSAAERVAICTRFADLLEARLEEMGVLWALEAGMPVRYSKTLHRFGAVGAWRTAIESAEAVLAPSTRPSPLGEVTVLREPAGVVLAIMSYNGPLVTLASKVMPALLAGCPVVLKAAPESQLIMRVVAVCAADAGFPYGTLSILCGDADLGRWLTAHQDVDLVSLTGGRKAAQEIIEATRHRFARTHLELGGKGPAVILDDAPIDDVLRTLVAGATSGTGQVCALLSRILVSQNRHDEVIDALRAAWSGLRIGDPLEPSTQLGPLTTRAALERTEGFVARARGAGARVVHGGQRPAGFERGYFFEPTLVTDVSRDSDLALNEVFGPVTAVLTYTDVDDAVELANATDFGLSATVYSNDQDLALRCAKRIRAGSVAVNTYGPTLVAPFGGVKGSGWGREAGPEGIAEFTELKQILLAPSRAR